MHDRDSYEASKSARRRRYDDFEKYRVHWRIEKETNKQAFSEIRIKQNKKASVGGMQWKFRAHQSHSQYFIGTLVPRSPTGGQSGPRSAKI